MQYRTLGRTELRVSEIGFGAWAISGGWCFQDESDLPELAETLIQKLRQHAWNRAFWYGGK